MSEGIGSCGPVIVDGAGHEVSGNGLVSYTGGQSGSPPVIEVDNPAPLTTGLSGLAAFRIATDGGLSVSAAPPTATVRTNMK